MTTPLRHQYLRIKRRYPNAILFFRLGDFYETFDDDARTVSEVCDIVLTSRPISKKKRVPMAGVPHHAAEGYIAKLLSAGYKVAVCEQLSEPGRGLVERDVVRVVTPGTLVEPEILPAGRNNYIAAVFAAKKLAGLAYADVSTGEFATTELQGEDTLTEIQRELSRLQPAELLLPEEHPLSEVLAAQYATATITLYPLWHWEEEGARQALRDYFAVERLDGFGCAGRALAVRAAGALLQYLQDTQQRLLRQIRALRTYSVGQYMTLDPQTRRNLELLANTLTGSLEHSLIWVLDKTRTAMGARMLRRWLSQPLLEVEPIERRLDAVELFVGDTALRTDLRERLHGMRDLERATSRVLSGIAGPRELLGVAQTLGRLPALGDLLRPHLPEDGLLSLPDPCAEVKELLDRAISEDAPAVLSAGGVIQPGFSAELDQVLAASQEARDWIASLENKERERTGIGSLKVGYNKVFGYYIEVPKTQESKVPKEYIRKQTLVRAERYITPELKEYEAIVLGAQERMNEIEARLYKEILQQLGTQADPLLAAALALARLDVCAALAEVAVRHRYVRPELDESEEIEIEAGRHPVVEVTTQNEPFIPNDVYLSCGEAQIIVLTGPNMSGKSTAIRQVALITLLAQIGSFVPAGRARIGLVDRIFTRVGAQDDLATGRSTFMVEMTETANILHHATRRSLIVLDEIGRGTSTYDGLAIARAVVEYLHNHPDLGSRTIFATHYHELTELAEVLPRLRNFNVAVSEEGGTVIFLRKIVPGGADRSYGIHVAQLAGLPRTVIHRAEEVLEQLEKRGDKEERREAMRQVTVVQQLPLFGAPPTPVLEALKTLRVEELTPLEAINKLYELKRMAEGE
ncbi:MAG: DNA mismatch repair protein MutS [Chloroflexia bacterium]|nr:DNA mismatch repair protein MutS [Chloroflexia bacterium]